MAVLKKIKKIGKDVLIVIIVMLWVAVIHTFLDIIGFNYYFIGCLAENSYTCTFFGLICANGYFMDFFVLVISFMIAMITATILFSILPLPAPAVRK